ncbi:hypothetical protein PCL_04361 [Purpureocillium lilacinum]|uniref:Uncharacterized protein n=1 Tax=Purpureocillium lilacinum TaxID=33203 RepID=A0A2U3DY63_PURLI|nr:hypothetical protein Purlil1_5326 [Purpureocillium lilacinum]PWI67199.1 hypothetical protein PCL_04361 [Purpureocillium lilacinum]
MVSERAARCTGLLVALCQGREGRGGERIGLGPSTYRQAGTIGKLLVLCFGWSDGGAARRGAGECALRWFRRESAAPEEAELASGGDVLVVGWNDTDGGAVPVLYQAPGTGETGDGGVVLGVAGAAGLARSYWGGTAGNEQRFGAVQVGGRAIPRFYVQRRRRGPTKRGEMRRRRSNGRWAGGQREEATAPEVVRTWSQGKEEGTEREAWSRSPGATLFPSPEARQSVSLPATTYLRQYTDKERLTTYARTAGATT